MEDLDKILEKYPFEGKWEDWKNLKVQLIAWRDKAVVAARVDELERATGYMQAGLRSRNYVQNRLQELSKDRSEDG